jgi:hypothetical protein
MRTRLILALILLPAVSDAGVFRWQDAEGVIHYSDRPVKDAEQLSISGAEAEKPADETPSESADSNVEDSPSKAYGEFNLVEPDDNQTFRSNAGEVSIAILLKPALDENHKIRLVVDGRALVGQFTSTQLMLRDVGRGSHTLQAIVVDGEGETVASTQVVTFHVRKAPLSEGDSESLLSE